MIPQQDEPSIFRKRRQDPSLYLFSIFDPRDPRFNVREGTKRTGQDGALIPPWPSKILEAPKSTPMLTLAY